MIYIASPYTHNDPDVRESRARAAAALAGELINSGELAYSPIAHGHAIYEEHTRRQGSLEFHYGAWRAHSLRMLRMCDRVEVLALPGWRESVGVTDELGVAVVLDMPIFYWCVRGGVFVQCSRDTAP